MGIQDENAPAAPRSMRRAGEPSRTREDSAPRKTNTQIVRDYLDSWQTNDPDRILVHFADHVVYHDIPLEPHQGIDRLAKRLKRFVGLVSESELKILNIAESESGEVFTERHDRMKINGKWFHLQVASVATVREGKIVAWREYWDAKTYERQMTEILGFPHKIEDLEN
jgi:limonene-1,2-epoxide hydrolase